MHFQNEIPIFTRFNLCNVYGVCVYRVKPFPTSHQTFPMPVLYCLRTSNVETTAPARVVIITAGLRSQGWRCRGI